MSKKLVPIIIITIIAGVIGFLANGLSGKATANPGDPAIDFELMDTNGNTIKLSDYKGEVVVLNFFATWCQPCIDEAPELEAFGTEYDGATLLIIAKGETKNRVQKFIDEYNSELIYLLDTKEEVSKNYHILGQPETLIIDKDGIIREKISGPTTKKELISKIKALDPN